MWTWLQRVWRWLVEQLQQLKAIGLRTFENAFSAPEGSMSLALDIVVDRPDIVETVRAYASVPVGPGNGIVALSQVNSNLVAAVTGSTSAAPVNAAGVGIQFYGSGTGGLWQTLQTEYWQLGVGQQFGPFALAADNKLDAFTMNSNVYVACDAGVYKWDGSSTTTRRYGAGILRPARVQVTGGAAGNFQLPGFGAVRYRAVFGRKDAFGNLVLGEPSPSYVYFNNGAGAFNTSLNLYMPTVGLDPGDIVQFYRSETTVGTSNNPVIPSDELQLVLEHVFTNGEVSGAVSSFLTFNDKCPDGARGAFLYTNPNTGQGSQQMNARPPLCTCATTFKNVAWYANTKTQQSLAVTFLDITSWVAGTTFSISNGTRTYTYTHAGVLTNASLNAVAALIADAINRPGGAGNLDLLAYVDQVEWSTTPNAAAQATVVFQTVGKGTDAGGTWTVTLGGAGPPSATSTSPVTTTAGSNRTLLSDDGPNRLYFSKAGQPDHVPLLNYQEIGNKGDPIVAISGLRDSLFVFKAKDGIFRVTGTSLADLRVEAFDPTVLITQTNSVGKASNRLFLASNKGIVWMDEGGVHDPPASRPIESDVLGLCANPQVGLAFVGRACESERKYSFIANGNTFYQYNYEMNAWTQRSVPVGAYVQAMTTGGIGPFNLSDRFFLGNNNGSSVQYIIPPAATNPNTYTALAQFAYVVIDGNNPGLKKRFNDVSIVLTGSTVTSLNVSFSSETTTTPETVSVPVTAGASVIRVQVPRSCSYASQLTLTVAAVNTGEYLKVSGVSVTTEGITTRTSR